MPNCFSLTRKSAPEAGPVSLSAVDEELCAHLGTPVHPTEYVHYWFDHIGFALACGRTLPELRERYAKAFNEEGDPFDKALLDIAYYLDTHFAADAWATR